MSLTRIYSVVLIIIVVGLAGALSAQIPAESVKLTPQALSAVQNIRPGETVKLWLYLDESAFDSSKVVLTDRARKRRARVDPRNYLIDEHDYPISDSALAAIRSTGVTVRRVSKWLKAVSVETDQRGVGRAAALGSVRKVDLMRTLVAPVDKELAAPKQLTGSSVAEEFDYGFSALQNGFINAIKLHRADLTGKGVLIAMLDTGFDPSHPALTSATVLATYDYINDDSSVDELDCPDEYYAEQQAYHGTATWSVIAGVEPDTLIGVAPDAEFMLFKTEITCGGTEIKVEEDNWIAAADSAETFGADIISSSVGYAIFTDSGSYTFEDLDGNTAAITIAADIVASKNVLVVTSAGNERNDPWGHIVVPADGDSVLAIGAANADSSLAFFSSPGPTADGRIKPDITALGRNVVAAFHQNGSYVFSSGTSYAAPLVAGGAALALEHDPTLTAHELYTLIRGTGSLYNRPDNNFGYGLYNAAAAADIIKFDRPHDFRIISGLTESFTVTTSGRTDSIPQLSGIGLPATVSFTDNGDGSGLLEITVPTDGPPTDSFQLVADVGYFVDTTTFTVTRAADPVQAGPNPFDDFVNIYVVPTAGTVRGVSIFNVAGEKVWEKVNNSAVNADESTIQWDGRNQSGKVVAAGAYVVLVVTDRQTYRIKLFKRQ